MMMMMMLNNDDDDDDDIVLLIGDPNKGLGDLQAEAEDGCTPSPHPQKTVLGVFGHCLRDQVFGEFCGSSGLTACAHSQRSMQKQKKEEE